MGKQRGFTSIPLSPGTCFNQVYNNKIGTDTSGAKAIPNKSYGIFIFKKANSNIIGPKNLIAFNSFHGMCIDGSNLDSTICNTITQNSFFSDTSGGIDLVKHGNLEVSEPVITLVGLTQIEGTALAGNKIELFADDLNQGKYYLGTVTADANGHFS
jgi:hypothetical protein